MRMRQHIPAYDHIPHQSSVGVVDGDAMNSDIHVESASKDEMEVVRSTSRCVAIACVVPIY